MAILKEQENHPMYLNRFNDCDISLRRFIYKSRLCDDNKPKEVYECDFFGKIGEIDVGDIIPLEFKGGRKASFLLIHFEVHGCIDSITEYKNVKLISRLCD